MNAFEVLLAVREHGAEVFMQDGQLLVRGSGEPLPDDLRAALSEQKLSIMVALGAPFDRATKSVLDDLRPYLSPTLRNLPDERVLVLVNWNILAAWRRTLLALENKP